MQLTGAQILVRTLIEQGADTVFGYPGGQVINIYDALHECTDQLRHVLTAHEQGASHAADGYARATGRPGVCLATSGPGATNLVTGLATAFLDSIPVVAITGNVPTDLLGRDSFQEVDITGVTMPVTKHNFLVDDATDIAQTIQDAFRIASSGRPGPVLVDITKNAQVQRIDYQPIGRYECEATPSIDPKDLEDAARLIRKSERPLLYVGGGIMAPGAAKSLLAFAEKMCLPIASTTRGLSAIPTTERLYLGMLGMHGAPVCSYAVGRCDLLICVGARFADRVTGSRDKFAPKAQKIHIDIDASEINKNIVVDCGIVGDATEALDQLAERLERVEQRPWLHELIQYKARNPLPENVNEQGVELRNVLKAVRLIMGEDTIIATDVGQHQMITAQYYHFDRPRTFLSSLGLGTMGFGMGAALGAQTAFPNRPVAMITGDGSFHMNFNEFATAVTEKLPIVVIVDNNQVLGMVRQWQSLFFEKRYSQTTPRRQTDFVQLAQALGGDGYRIESNDEIRTTLQNAYLTARANQRPCIIECAVDPNEFVFPIIPPGGTGEDTIYEAYQGMDM